MVQKNILFCLKDYRLVVLLLQVNKADASVGNCLPLRNIPVGFMVHNIEITPGSGGKFARSAGTSVQLMAKTEEHATLKMPSGEIRMVPIKLLGYCWCIR